MNTLERFEALGRKWFIDSPFLSEFMLSFSFREDNSCPTIGVILAKDRRNLQIVFNNDFCSGLTDAEFEGVMVHEVWHVIGLTGPRQGKRNPLGWNVATDFANNYEILTKCTIAGRKLELPKGGCFIENLTDKQGNKYTGKIIAEDIYDFLKENYSNEGGENSKGNGQDGEGNDGSGSGESGDGEFNPNGMKPFDDHSGLNDLGESQVVKQLAKDILSNAQKKQWGKLSGEMISAIQELSKPRLNLGKLIFSQLKQMEARGNSIVRNTYKKLNRRKDDYLPGKVGTQVKLWIAIDTSGSIGEREFKRFFGEIDAMASFFDINVIQWDTKIAGNDKYRKGAWKKFQVKGGGGTDPQCLVDFFVDRKEMNPNLVVFSDGCFNWNIDYKGMNKKAPFWILTSDMNPDGVRKEVVEIL